jgi:phage recombination protein Bet
MAATQELVVKKEPASVEFIPYGGQDKIKLSVSIVQNLIAVKTKSGKTCSDRDAIKFLAMCQAKRINPFEGDCFLIGYDTNDGPSFALVTAHQTYLKRAELHAEFDGMKSGIIVEEDGTLKDLEGDFYIEGQKLMGGWATVYFKNRKFPMTKRLRLSRFNKGHGIWRDDPAGMICKCAEADALRSSFPTMLGGLYLREELEIDPKKPEFAKPLFAEPAKVAEITNGHAAAAGAAEPPPAASPVTEAELPQTDAPEKDPEFGPQPEAERVKPKPVEKAPAQPGPLSIIRQNCQRDGVEEGKLLDFLSQIGATDGSFSDLEELILGNEKLTKIVIRDWPSMVQRIKGKAAA